MPWNRLTLATALAATLSLSAIAIAQEVTAPEPDPAIATMTSEQLVAERQNEMMQNGRTMRSAAGLTGEEAVTGATAVLQNFVNLSHMFSEGSIVGDSKALPAIFEQRELFDSIFARATAAAAQMLQAAQAGDTTLYAEAVGTIQQTCNECHNTFRGR